MGNPLFFLPFDPVSVASPPVVHENQGLIVYSCGKITLYWLSSFNKILTERKTRTAVLEMREARKRDKPFPGSRGVLGCGSSRFTLL